VFRGWNAGRISFQTGLSSRNKRKGPARGQIDADQYAAPHSGQTNPYMANLVFKCPRTGMNVQHWLAEESAPGDPSCTYETVHCQACSRLHFINRSSRKLLGDKGE
jgi:hypothetical protein